MFYNCIVNLNEAIMHRHPTDGNDPLTKFVSTQLCKLGVKVPKNKKYKPNNVQINTRSAAEKKYTFGVPLHEQEFDVSEGSGIAVPLFLKHATKYLLDRKCSDGLFRKAGSVQRLKELKKKVENGGNLEGAQVNDIASLLKQWYRELPETVIPKHLNELFIKCYQVEPESNRITAIVLACLLLPPENLHTLRHTLQFLSSIAAESHSNRMTVYNLAVVMTPNLMYSHCLQDKAKKASEILQCQTDIIKLLIENSENIGRLPPGLSENVSGPVLMSDDELEKSGDELEGGQSKKKRKQAFMKGLRKIVPQRKGTPATPCTPVLTPMIPIQLDHSPRILRSDLKRKADTELAGSPSKKPKSPAVETTEKEKNNLNKISDWYTPRSRTSVTSLVSVHPLISCESYQPEKKVLRPRVSTRSLGSAAQNKASSSSLQDTSVHKVGTRRHGRKSITFFVGCNSMESSDSDQASRTPFLNRSTLKRGRPNTVYTGLPSPFKPKQHLSDSFLQTPKDEPDLLQQGNLHHSDPGDRSLSKCLFMDCNDNIYEDAETPDIDLVGFKNESYDNMMKNSSHSLDISNKTMSRQSSYSTVYSSLEKNSNDWQDITFMNVSNVGHQESGFGSRGSSCNSSLNLNQLFNGSNNSIGNISSNTKEKTLNNSSFSKWNNRSSQNTEMIMEELFQKNLEDSPKELTPEVNQGKTDQSSSSSESTWNVSKLNLNEDSPLSAQTERIEDGMFTPVCLKTAAPPTPLSVREAKLDDKDIFTKLPCSAKKIVQKTPKAPKVNDVSWTSASAYFEKEPLPEPEGTKRESIVQIRRKNAGMVKNGVQLYDSMSLSIFCTPTAPAGKRTRNSTKNSDSIFSRNAPVTRSLRNWPQEDGKPSVRHTMSACSTSEYGKKSSPLAVTDRLNRPAVLTNKGNSKKICSGENCPEEKLPGVGDWEIKM